MQKSDTDLFVSMQPGQYMPVLGIHDFVSYIIIIYYYYCCIKCMFVCVYL